VEHFLDQKTTNVPSDLRSRGRRFDSWQLSTCN